MRASTSSAGSYGRTATRRRISKVVADTSPELAASAATVEEASKAHAPIALLVQHGDVYRTISVAYVDGPRYPHLVRIDGAPDRLSEVVKPRS